MHNLKLKIGESHDLIFAGGSSGGYKWNYEIKSGSDNVEIEQHSKIPKLETGISETLPNTFEAEIIFTIKAIKEGAVLIKFFLSRIWENEKPPLREDLVNIEIYE